MKQLDLLVLREVSSALRAVHVRASADSEMLFNSSLMESMGTSVELDYFSLIINLG